MTSQPPSFHSSSFHSFVTTIEDVRRIIDKIEYECAEPYQLQSAQTTLSRMKGHCLDSSLVAAHLMGQFGYRPLMLAMDVMVQTGEEDSHAAFLYKTQEGYFSMGNSRHSALCGRKNPFSHLVDLADDYKYSLQQCGYATQRIFVEDWSDATIPWRDSPSDLAWESNLVRVIWEEKYHAPFSHRIRRAHRVVTDLFSQRGTKIPTEKKQ
ncbi:hypothetical protein HYV86_00810 [Candidatus Woesearchaeota archaeon]|nr:hypothetical protein [Candidatus Woesearchaeota archaeon]